MALEFTQPVDIANFGLQLLGVDAITATSFQIPDSKAAREMARCYDLLRVAELRRNTWRFATRRAVLRAIDPATVLWTPPAYSSVATYTTGQVAVFQGDWYQAQPGVAVGDIPNIATTWLRYFGPLMLDPFDTSGETAYFAGDLVVVPEVWAIGNTYAINTIIARNNLFYTSLTGSNIGHDPATDTTHWTPYVKTGGPFVYSTFGAGPVVYLSLVTTPSAANIVLLPPPATNWLAVNGTVTTLQILYPLGTGPAWQISTNNIYRLPYGYLRKCPQNPKGQLDPPVGGPAYNAEDDALIEGNYLVSASPGPVVLRFVADVIDVSDMDEMFCRMLASSMAVQACEPLDQAADKKADARAAYRMVRGEAIIVNGIETGTVDPVEDEYIMARL